MTDAILPIIWYFIIAAELALYIILDGANLGVGLLSLLPQREDSRSHMMQILGPIWNANETWLLVAAGTTFGAFPIIYAVGLNALYFPALIAGAGLILRAAAFAFHENSTTNQWMWAKVFGLGSLFVVLGHGFLLGGLLSGITIVDGHFAGGPFDWATPLTALFTIGIFFSYVVLGYAYLMKSMDYQLAVETFPRILASAGITLAALTGATFILPLKDYSFLTRWTTPPSETWLFFIAGFIGIAAMMLGYYAVTRSHPERLFALCIAIFGLGFMGMLVGIYPFIIPGQVTLFDAASPASTLRFMLYGLGPLLPIVLAYNWYLHRVFRGKWHAGTSEGY